MLIAMLKVLQEAHKQNINHRDVKPDNIYLNQSDNGNIVLSDWSSSVVKGLKCQYEGIPLYGGPPETDGTHTPSVALDLRSVVRTSFSLSKQRRPLVHNTETEAKQYWTKVANDYPPFQKAMEAAELEDYQSKENLLRTQW